MAEHSGNSRTSRSRKAIALMAWGCLAFCAFFLWNERVTGNLLQAAYEPVALLLSAFAAFVGVFAWMLFNPNQKTTAETPTLFLSAVATLFPPPIIGFNLMPEDSPLRWWLALGVFLLIVIALLSHVPDEFFGVPRGRSTYIMPLPIFDSVADEVMDPKAAWFTFSDLSQIVPDVTRPSLAPRAYLNQEQERKNTNPVVTAGVVPASADDLLNVDAEIGLLDDTLLDYELDSDLTDRPYQEGSYRQPAQPPTTQQPSPIREPRRRTQQPVRQERSTKIRRQTSGTKYQSRRKHSQRLQREQSSRRTTHSSSGYRLTRRDRLADSIKATPVASTTLADAYDRALPQSETSLQRDLTSVRSQTVSRSSAGTSQTASKRGQTVSTPPPAPLQRPPERQTSTSASSTSSRDKKSTTSTRRKSGSRDRSSNSLTAGVLPVPLPPVESPSLDVTQKRSAKEDPLTESINAFVTAEHPPQSPVARKQLPKPPVRPSRTNEHQAQPAREIQRPSTGPEIQRSTDAGGSVIVEGTMPIRFEAGQKRANVHIPFSPPLPSSPEVEAECVGEGDLRLKVPVKQTYGIRIEARRTDDSESLDSEIAFAAIAE